MTIGEAKGLNVQLTSSFDCKLNQTNNSLPNSESIVHSVTTSTDMIHDQGRFKSDKSEE